MTAPVLDTNMDPDSEAFRASAAHNRGLVEKLRATGPILSVHFQAPDGNPVEVSTRLG